MKKNKKTIIFDLDDTLIDTSHLYWSVKYDILNFIHSKSNVSYKELDIMFEEIEHKNTIKFGYDPSRYKISANELCSKCDIKDIKDINYINKIADRIILDDPKLIEGAEELLSYLYSKYNLVLLTSGIQKLQFRKIKNNGLNRYFGEKNTKVVEKKDLKIFIDFLKELSLLPENCFVIGDSIKSDINPAMECGIKAIHYNYKHEYYEWEQDKAETQYSFNSVDKLLDIKEIL